FEKSNLASRISKFSVENLEFEFKKFEFIVKNLLFNFKNEEFGVKKCQILSLKILQFCVEKSNLASEIPKF
uniref:Uncharacterized protein n=1 Tax=Romanomermis culicivorax TaxID=13658 RepID=A0A915JB43_ROMCU